MEKQATVVSPEVFKHRYSKAYKSKVYSLLYSPTHSAVSVQPLRP